MEERTFPPELEPLRDELNEISLTPTIDGTPIKLYHYTDHKGMEGILKSGMLWTTCLPCLEDKLEIEYPITLCREYMETRHQEESGVRKHFMRDAILLDCKSTDIMHCLEKQAAVSFSKEIGVQSQWADYADHGHGYALGFASPGLLKGVKSRNRDRNSATDVNWTLCAMVYDAGEQRRILQELLEKVFACPQFARPRSAEIRNWLTVLALYSFGIAAAGFKAPKFAPEHEVRLTIANHRELSLAGTALPTKQRLRNGRMVEYLEFDLRHLETGVMPLKEIVIGPEADGTKAVRIVRSAIESSGYVDVEACQIRQMQL